MKTMLRQHSYTTIVLWIAAFSLSLPFRQVHLSVLALEDSESLNFGVKWERRFIRGRPRNNAAPRVLGRRYDDDDYQSNLDEFETDDLSYDDYDDSKKRKKDHAKSKDNDNDRKGKNNGNDKKNNGKNNDDGANEGGNIIASIISNSNGKNNGGKNNGGKNNGKGKNNGGKNNGKGKNKGETPVP